MKVLEEPQNFECLDKTHHRHPARMSQMIGEGTYNLGLEYSTSHVVCISGIATVAVERGPMLRMVPGCAVTVPGQFELDVQSHMHEGLKPRVAVIERVGYAGSYAFHDVTKMHHLIDERGVKVSESCQGLKFLELDEGVVFNTLNIGDSFVVVLSGALHLEGDGGEVTHKLKPGSMFTLDHGEGFELSNIEKGAVLAKYREDDE